jgi:hypothetical protein
MAKTKNGNTDTNFELATVMACQLVELIDTGKAKDDAIAEMRRAFPTANERTCERAIIQEEGRRSRQRVYGRAAVLVLVYNWSPNDLPNLIEHETIEEFVNQVDCSQHERALWLAAATLAAAKSSFDTERDRKRLQQVLGNIADRNIAEKAAQSVERHWPAIVMLAEVLDGSAEAWLVRSRLMPVYCAYPIETSGPRGSGADQGGEQRRVIPFARRS